MCECVLCSLSGCPRALYAKKKAKFPTEDYLSNKFRASDGKMFMCQKLYLNKCTLMKSLK